MTTPGILRTPDARFANLPEFPWQPRYCEVDGLRMAWVEDGDPGGEAVLLLHGEPTWSYLYRKMIPPLAAAGFRAIAPDLVGFGRSDKPAKGDAYSYARHVAWVGGFVDALGLEDITLVCQDWGSLIGLRLAGERPERFARIVVANGFLPAAGFRLPAAFRAWRAFARWTPLFPAGWIVQAGCARTLPARVRRAYDAPFPSRAFQAGARAFPRLVPDGPGDPAAAANERAWAALGQWRKPFLTVFGDRDPIFAGADRALQRQVPGAKGQAHARIRRAGHFVQEDAGEELAGHVVEFMRSTPR